MLERLAARKAGIEDERGRITEELADLDVTLGQLVGRIDAEQVAGRLNDRYRKAQARLADCEQHLQICEELEAWYRSIPDEVEGARTGIFEL
jgi:hypothetical protein